MTLLLHELKRGRLPLIVWSAAIAFMLGVSILIYPEMTAQMEEINQAFSNMGAFSDAFGMSEINFGEFMGYFGVECGNVLGLGGALFAAIMGIWALSQEERDGTAELLLTHPVSRRRVVAQKLLALLAKLVLLNLAVSLVALLAILAIGVEAQGKTVFLIFLAYFLLQLELACITFGISAFLRRGGLGIGMGLALMLYFLNIVSNLVEQGEVLKYVTPFGYADGTAIVSDGGITLSYLLPGMLIALVFVGIAFWQYEKKDIF